MKWLLALLAALLPLPAAAQAVLIQGARVFDGSGHRAQVRDVLVRGERIVQVRRHVKPPADARVVDARGLTLLPGLHDLHIHTRQQAFQDAFRFAEAYSPYLARGVTSVNEYSVSGPMLQGIRAFPGPAPHIALAIRLGVPDGHGTESRFTNSITSQVTTPGEAHAAMTAALVYRPDVIKVFADGWRYGDPGRPDRPSMDLATLAAIVADAHRAGIPVVTHTVTLAGARIAARAGVDAVVHGIGDAPVDAELIRLMKRHRMAYVPTMVVYEPQENRSFLPEEWPLLSDEDQADERARMAKPPEPIAPYDSKRWAILQENLRRLHAAHVRIGVGTDTGIGGVGPGWSTIREIRWLVTLGFKPREALAAATSVSAGIMGQGKSHGRIRKGQRADLVLTGGRPDERIEDLYDVRHVFVSGREVDLPVRRAAIAR
ncbi:MAG: amidohydrolase family protein [Pseudomonadota bacterium]